MLNFLDIFAKLFLDSILFTITYAAILNVKLSSIIKRIPYVLLCMLSTAGISMLDDSSFWQTIVAWIYAFIYLMILYGLPLQKNLYTFAFTHIICSLIQLSMVVATLPFTDMPFTKYSAYIADPINILIVFLIYRFAHLNKAYDTLVVKNSTSRYIILGVFMFLMLMTAYQRLSPIDFIRSLMTLVIVLIVILILYTGMYKNYMSLRESQKQLQSYEQYLPIIEDLINQVRMRQHDYNNELQAISMLPISYTDYESLTAALTRELNASYADHVIKNSHLLKINMKLIAGFLFSKMNLAQERNIDLDIDVKNSTITSKAPEFELLDVMSILVDNAFDATGDGGHIKVIIDSDGETTTVETFNAGPQLTAEMRKNFFAKGYSTKPLKDGAYSRGIGLYKLKQLTSKYHGDILLDNQMIDGQNCIHFVVRI